MKLVIYINNDFEEQRTLFNLESKEVLLTGDYDNDKIDDKIEGYLTALHNFNIYKDDVEYDYIDENHEYYELAF